MHESGDGLFLLTLLNKGHDIAAAGAESWLGESERGLPNTGTQE
jgi:hypothetical protein